MDKIIDLMKKEQYLEAYNIMKGYIDEGYGVSFDFAIKYINCLIKLRKLDEASHIACSILPYVKNARYRLSLGYPLFYLKKYDKVMDMFSNGFRFDAEKMLLADVYFSMGEIEKCEELCEYLVQNSNEVIPLKNAKDRLVSINNNRLYNAFLPIDYSSFIEKGNSLEPGHVVYLNEEISTKDNVSDPKRNSRPYMIYSIDKDDLILFPVSTKTKDNDYRLYGQNYPNIGVDRKIKSAIVLSKTYNVEKVIDKIKSDDFNLAMNNVFFDVYLNSNDENKNLFLSKRTKLPEEGNMIKTIYKDNDNIVNKYYFIFKKNEKNYFGVEIDNKTYETNGIISIFDNNEVPFRTIVLDEDKVSLIKSNIKKNIKHNDIKLYDIVEFKNKNIIDRYLVVSISKHKYAIVKVDIETHSIISNAIICNKGFNPYNIYSISEEEINQYKESLDRSLSGWCRLLK